MAIEPTGPVGPHRLVTTPTARVEPARPRAAASRAPREDSIDLSPEARSLAGREAAERDQRLREIRDQVQSGAYRIDANAVAKEMLERGDA